MDDAVREVQVRALLSSLSNPQPVASCHIDPIGIVSIEGTCVFDDIRIDHDSIVIDKTMDAATTSTTNSVKFWRYVNCVGDLQRLRSQIDEVVALPRDNDSVNPIVSFLDRCDMIFQHIHDAVIRKTQPKIRSASYFRWLKDHLATIEFVFGSEAITKLNSNCSSVELCYRDLGQREHSIYVNLSSFDTVTNSFTNYFPYDETRPPPSKRQKLDRINRMDEMPDLLALFREFGQRIEELQDLFNELGSLDEHCRVIESKGDETGWHKRSTLQSERKIKIARDNFVIVRLQLKSPRSLPVLSFEGTEPRYWESQFEPAKWNESLPVHENLKACLNVQLPEANPVSLVSELTDGDDNCMICFGDGNFNDEDSVDLDIITCDNRACTRKYHTSCLRNWLVTQHDSRINFDRIIGLCPYCKSAVSVEMEEF